MNLRDLKIDTKEVEVDFPGLEGFKVKLGYITRETSTKLQKESTVTKLDKKYKMPVEEIDTDIFVKKFVQHAIKGWSGLKYKYLQNLLLVDLSSVEDVEKELDYSLENAIDLMKGSQAFDNWVNEVIFDLERFRDS